MHRDALDDAGIVDEDVYLSDFCMDLFYEVLHGILVCHVADVAFYVLNASLLVVVKSALQGCLIDVVEDDGLDASGYESLGNVETDTVRTLG